MSTGEARGIIGSRAVGKFFSEVEVDYGQSWVPQLAMKMLSDQASEIYAWLQAAPALREWIGGRNAVGLSANKISIINKTFEATLAFPTDDIRRDKIDAIDTRISDLVRRVTGHWAKLLSTLIQNGTGEASGLCYDGQYFFDIDHSEGVSGTQLNLLAAAQVAALGAVTTPTAPTPLEAANCVLGVIAYMMGWKDDKGEPINDMARSFLVMTSPILAPAFSAAVSQRTLGGNVDNPLAAQKNWEVSFIANPRLNYTTQFVVFRTDGAIKPFILQEELPIRVDVIGEGSEHEFKNNEQLFGVKLIGNCGYGLWQRAAHATMS